jgi:putative tryptophan/tyrosine transport system substrate-binding protein
MLLSRHTRRRDFFALVGSAVAEWPLVSRAQQSDQIRRIGVLMGTAAEDTESKAELTAFRDSLAKLGWVEGNTIHIDYRYPDNPDQYPRLAKELIALQPGITGMPRINRRQSMALYDAVT